MRDLIQSISKRRKRFGQRRPFRRFSRKDWRLKSVLLATVPVGAMTGCVGIQPPPVSASTPAAVEASYYGNEFAGRPTASGEMFNPEQLTAAHRTLPFGSMVKVTDAETGKSVVVKVNDRGPFHEGRDIDLSEAAARQIGMLDAGAAKVNLEVIGRA